jgi:6-phosphogluconolactonase (cycloisomerase 2 family)
MFNDAFSDATPKVKYFGYVTTSTNRLYSYRVLESGIFEAVGTPATIVSNIANPARITIHPSNDFIYLPTNGSILCYKINNDGSLSSVGIINNGIANSLLTIHPSGKFLYSISSATGNSTHILLYNINEYGTLIYVDEFIPNIVDSFIPPLDPIEPISGKTCAIRLSNDGKKLYITAIYSETYPSNTFDYLISYSVSADGQLTSEKITSFNNSALEFGDSIYIHPNGEFLYASAGPTYILKLRLNTDGTATGLFLANSVYSKDIFINQTGTFLYSSEATGQGIAMFGIYSDGSLYSIGHTPVMTGTQPSFIAEHPDGHYLYQADTSNKYIVVYNMNPGGNLTYNGIACTFNNALEYSIDVKIVGKTVYGANK